MARRSARGLAFDALEEWRTDRSHANDILGRLLDSSRLIESDRALATGLFYGVLRNITLLDYWIATLRSKPLQAPARDLLRLGLCQLLLLGIPDHAAVNETVKLARLEVRSLVNAVLRHAVRKKESLLRAAKKQSLSTFRSHPQFLIDRWTENFGAENTATLCEWNNQPAPIYARINRLRISVDSFLLQDPTAERVQQSNFVRLPAIPSEGLARGECYVQDPSTAIACHLLDPSPGEYVLDACAAPGGKTGYLAELMKNDGVLWACDRVERRIQTLEGNLRRLGVTIARVTCHDWLGDKPSPNGNAPTRFDRILVDAPCSNTGVMRRRADLRWRLTPDDFRRLQQEQLGILRAIIPLLKVDGVLVYSTCSIEPEENEDVVQLIIEECPSLRPVEERKVTPFHDQFDGAYAAKLVRKG